MPHDYKDFAKERDVSTNTLIHRRQQKKMNYGYENPQILHEAKELLFYQRVHIVQRDRNFYFNIRIEARLYPSILVSLT